MALKAKSPASRRLVGRIDVSVKPGRRRKFIVDIASPIGGGRKVVYATSPANARDIGVINTFGSVALPAGTDIIVTDLSKKTDAQSFYGPTKTRQVAKGLIQK